MRRSISFITGVVALLATATTLATGTTAPASAITDGSLDGDDHPYVGLMIARDADGFTRCSGALLSPTLFLTAGHCTWGAEHVALWFDEGPVEPDPDYDPEAADPCAGIAGYPCRGEASGTAHTHPDFDPDDFHLADLGVVVLDEPVLLDRYAELPSLNELDSLAKAKHVAFTAVGYGLQRAFPEAAAWKDETTRVRMVASPRLIKINRGFVGDFAMIVSANANTGGTCSGDSGGPMLLGSSDVVAGVTSFSNNDLCAGQAGVYRVDRSDDLGWLGSEFADHL